MDQRKPGNYLRTHRKRSGLTQEEIASIVGWTTGAVVSHYEWGRNAPSLQTALALGILFRVPVAKLFSGIHEAMREETEARISKLESQLQKMAAEGPAAVLIAKKLVWFTKRKIS